MSGELKWNYLGCYKKNTHKPVISGAPVLGNSNQTSCLNKAQSHKLFALQGSKGDNCYVGNELAGAAVADSECAAVCHPLDEQKIRGGTAGCGSMEIDQDKPFSVYSVEKGIMPQNVTLNRNDFIVDGAPDTMKFKNGLYTFSDSSHAWHWSAKRAFDDNANTYWHTPYTYGNYRMKRSKNYSNYNYVQPEKSIDNAASYNMRQKPYKRSLMRDPRKQFITVATPEAKVDETDNRDPIVHYGEWIQVDYPYKVFVTGFAVHPARLGNRSPVYEFARMPKHYVLLGSNDGEKWYPLHVENNNKYATDLLNSGNINGSTINNFIKVSQTNPLGGAYSQVIPNKNYSKFRLVVKETYGYHSAAIGNLKIQGKVCISMDGNCNVQNTDALDKLRSGKINELASAETFSNINENDIISTESFTNIINNSASDPIKELNVFNSDYSKYN